MTNSPTAGHIDALIHRMADFHLETTPSGVETICIKNCREIAEAITFLYERQPAEDFPFDYENPMDHTELRDFYIQHNGVKP